LRFITKIKDYLDKLQLAGTGSSKTKFIMNLLAKVQMKNERVLIFSRQKRYLDHLEPLINKEFNISCEYIHGDVEAPERQSIAERINKSKAFGVCLLTTQAGN
jgi:SNF2 family DNA or RNA helicase